MTFIVGVTHPKGESDSYDGMYLKESEFEKISNQLVGKPLLYNHDNDCVIGNVVSAWCSNGKNGDRELFTLCEIDESSLDGNLAKHAIEQGILKDFSLGHDIKVEQSRNSRRVVEKRAVEVSVCKKGARDNTHIYAISFEPKKKYINIGAVASNDQTKMSTTEQQVEEQKATAETPEVVENTTESPTTEEAPVQLTHSVLQQLKTLQEQNALLAADIEKYQQLGKRTRESVVNNGVQDYINGLIESNPELAEHKEEIEILMQKMVESERGTPLVKMLQAAASKSSNSVVELEKAYQEQKKRDSRIKQLEDELEAFKKDAFSLPHERMSQNTVSAVASSSTKKQRFSNSLFEEIDSALKNNRSNAVPKIDTSLYNKSRFSDII